MVNLFFSGGAYGSIWHNRKIFNIDKSEQFVSIDLRLCVGNLSKPFDPECRRDVVSAFQESLFESFIDDLKALNDALRNDKDLCIWFSDKDVDEYVGMLASVAEFEKKGITLFLRDCSEICESVLDIQYMDHVGTAERCLLTRERMDELLTEWESIRSENAAHRIIRDGHVVGLPVYHIDDRIFEIIGNNKILVRDICEKLISDPEIPLVFLLYRLRQLVDEGRITVLKEALVLDGAYGPNEKDFMRYLIKATAPLYDSVTDGLHFYS